MSPLPIPVAAESDDHRCTCKRYSRCDGCDTDRCCSPSGYCGSGRGYCRPCNCPTKGCCDPPPHGEKQLPAFYENAMHAAVVDLRHNATTVED
ncbi:unnamed protein product [Linum trigynum]